MGVAYPSLSERQKEFIAAQDLFFVATAPSATDERVNLSPKGYNKLHVFAPNRVGYLDLTGSGNETAAHLRDNGRMTIMLFAMSGDPLILRLYGYGRVVRPDHADWDELYAAFEPMPGERQIIMLDVTEVRESCGFMVPHYEKVSDRNELTEFASSLGPAGIAKYQLEENLTSIDGLPTGLREPEEEFE